MATELREQKSIIGLPLYVVGATVLLGGALFYFLSLAPNRAAAELPLTAEAKDYVRGLQLSDVTMQANETYVKQLIVEIEGKIKNGGDRNLDLVEIYCIFHDSYGQVVLKKRVPIVSPRMGGLKPGDTKSFRLPFDELPDSWNHAMPSLVIAGIRFS